MKSSFPSAAEHPAQGHDPVAELCNELTPEITESQASRLLDFLKDAQRNPPKDRKEFVDRINRVFDLYRICICTGDNEIYRLKYIPGGSGKGYIYLLNGHSKNYNTFSSSQLNLIDVSSWYEGNKRAHDIRGNECPVVA